MDTDTAEAGMQDETVVWLLWDGRDYYGPDLVDVYATKDDALKAWRGIVNREADESVRRARGPLLVSPFSVPSSPAESVARVEQARDRELSRDPTDEKSWGDFTIERKVAVTGRA